MPADVTLPFELPEYARRLERVRTAMAVEGLDTLIAVDPANIAWLTGYDGWSFYNHQCVVVTHDDDPIFWGRSHDTHGARRTVWMDDDHIVGYPDRYVQAGDLHPMEHLVATLRDRRVSPRVVGVELDGHYYTAAAHRTLVEGLRARLEDATTLVNWQRAVKSPRELDYMRIAGSIVERVHQRVRELLRPGLRKNELVAEIYHAALAGTPSHGGDYPAIAPLLPSGADGAACHLTWDDRPMRAGEGTYFELAGCHRRYHAPLARTAYIGTPPEPFRRAEAALLDGLERGIETARAGNRACDVADALASALRRAGFERDVRCGYPIGLAYPPDWGERTISLRGSDATVLEPGMTFHFMPALWMDDWGIEITESIVIRDDGPADTLAEVPRELFVVDV